MQVQDSLLGKALDVRHCRQGPVARGLVPRSLPNSAGDKPQPYNLAAHRKIVPPFPKMASDYALSRVPSLMLSDAGFGYHTDCCDKDTILDTKLYAWERGLLARPHPLCPPLSRPSNEGQGMGKVGRPSAEGRPTGTPPSAPARSRLRRLLDFPIALVNMAFVYTIGIIRIQNLPVSS